MAVAHLRPTVLLIYCSIHGRATMAFMFEKLVVYEKRSRECSRA